ncbi:ABC-type multidrug transport system ATPase subunit [Haloferula luteola]|uniref:ABC-type multidrug transport system ATPase subunit n=1 Tax=Haloferula luteola TaxID=595692 RepID=A0A840V2Z4_9BACT|nr:ATP-binding cassette domain-containing protein [Haloferula luteola]MBB5352365.1 ABC-type multidrug transport system ATPase subunit [Haloferula luteola]
MALPSPKLELCPGLTIGYRTPLAATESSIELGKGTHFLLARNGRGKTTLLRTIARSLRPLKGKIIREGVMQYLPENLTFDGELNARTIFKALIPGPRLAEAIELAESIELDLRKNFGHLSTGNRRKTSLIVAEFSPDPQTPGILLLDEPFSGLDAFAREKFEQRWTQGRGNILRLVSCHPDYDSMPMPSALVIESGHLRHLQQAGQTWQALKSRLN